jgi:hypothetical protein
MFAIRTRPHTDQNCKRDLTSSIPKRISKYFPKTFKGNKCPTHRSEKSTQKMTLTDDIKISETHERQDHQAIIYKA